MSRFSCFGFWKEVNEYRIFADLTRILLAFGGSSNCNGDLICWGQFHGEKLENTNLGCLIYNRILISFHDGAVDFTFFCFPPLSIPNSQFP